MVYRARVSSDSDQFEPGQSCIQTSLFPVRTLGEEDATLSIGARQPFLDVSPGRRCATEPLPQSLEELGAMKCPAREGSLTSHRAGRLPTKVDHCRQQTQQLGSYPLLRTAFTTRGTG